MRLFTLTTIFNNFVSKDKENSIRSRAYDSPISKRFDRERILVRKSRPLKKKELEHNAMPNAARHAKQTTHIRIST